MQTCSKIIGVSTDELLNNNIRYFMDRMYEQGIYNINIIVSLIDTMFNGIRCQELKIENIEGIRLTVYSFIFDNLISKWIKEGKNSDEIYKVVIDFLDNGYIQNEIKKDSDFALLYFNQQNSFRKCIIQFVNMLLERANMPIKTQKEIIDMLGPNEDAR